MATHPYNMEDNALVGKHYRLHRATPLALLVPVLLVGTSDLLLPSSMAVEDYKMFLESSCIFFQTTASDKQDLF